MSDPQTAIISNLDDIDKPDLAPTASHNIDIENEVNHVQSSYSAKDDSNKEFSSSSEALGQLTELQEAWEVNGASQAKLSSQMENGKMNDRGKVNGTSERFGGVPERSHSPLNSSDGRTMSIIREESEEKDEAALAELKKVDSETKKTVLKLTPAQLYELTASPGLMPVSPPMTGKKEIRSQPSNSLLGAQEKLDTMKRPREFVGNGHQSTGHSRQRSGSDLGSPSPRQDASMRASPAATRAEGKPVFDRPSASRAFSTPTMRKPQPSQKPSATQDRFKVDVKSERPNPTPRLSNPPKPKTKTKAEDEEPPSPTPIAMPLPPLSIPTFLQLELSSHKPSPLYIYRSSTNDVPYEDSRIKIERLLNFLLLPPQLEMVLWFGALACLDSWLYTFTILPLRFTKAFWILLLSWARNLIAEFRFFASFIYAGVGRMWKRRKINPDIKVEEFELRGSDVDSETTAVEKPVLSPDFRFPPLDKTSVDESDSLEQRPHRSHSAPRWHKRARSAPSKLLQDHKADLLKGLLIIISCVLLLYLDASKMYHSIRGQAAIKLYVIYNVLEVFDRLLAALGQDVLECLFSRETLERKPDGRSKIWRPFWLFSLALVYNLVHTATLFYQVMTLNVAVNSYSNALLTLLMSNQFVEIKSTVFKKVEKDNLFQLTCADVVERFQLWLMLMIIVARNIIETNGLSGSQVGSGSSLGSMSKSSSILPKSFTMLPDWTGQIIDPFLLVLGTEMLVDWVKHAYITKFNNTKPNIYGRFLDVLAKDYYSNAFSDPNLSRRVGLPTIPLSCLFIRASIQTYHMFLATHVPPPLSSTATALSVEPSTSTSPATIAALQHIDYIVRHAFGRSALTSPWPSTWLSLTTNDIIALSTKALFFFSLYLVLLCVKLLLGMLLLAFARNRYVGMKQRERGSNLTAGRRFGGWGVTEVDDAKRKWIYEDDDEGLKRSRERQKRALEAAAAIRDEKDLEHVSRYSMVAKRIW